MAGMDSPVRSSHLRRARAKHQGSSNWKAISHELQPRRPRETDVLEPAVGKRPEHRWLRSGSRRAPRDNTPNAAERAIATVASQSSALTRLLTVVRRVDERVGRGVAGWGDLPRSLDPIRCADGEGLLLGYCAGHELFPYPPADDDAFCAASRDSRRMSIQVDRVDPGAQVVEIREQSPPLDQKTDSLLRRQAISVLEMLGSPCLGNGESIQSHHGGGDLLAGRASFCLAPIRR